MKKIIFILLFIIGILFQIRAESSISTDKQFRDSIFQTVKFESNDTLRSKILRNAFQQYMGKDIALDSWTQLLRYPDKKGYMKKSYTSFLITAVTMNSGLKRLRWNDVF